LDTTVLIDHLRDAPAAQRLEDLLQRGDLAATTPINIEEVVRGLRVSEEQTAATLIEALIVIPLGAKEAWRAGAWRRDHAARGVTLSQADCLIAAAAAESEAVLATGNPKHFPMTGVEVEHWPAGH